MDKQLLSAQAQIYCIQAEVMLTDRPMTGGESVPPSRLSQRSMSRTISSRQAARDRSGNNLILIIFAKFIRLIDRLDIMKTLLAALAIATQIKEEWLIINIFIYFYNYFSPLFKTPGPSQRDALTTYEKAASVFQECFSALTQNITPNYQNMAVLLNLCDAYASTLEVLCQIKRRNNPMQSTARSFRALTTPLPSSSNLVAQLASPVQKEPISKDDFAIPEIKQAEDVCKTALSWTTDTMAKKRLLQ